MTQTQQNTLWQVIKITCAAAIGGFLFGFDSAVINGTTLALKATFDASDASLGAAVSVALLSAAAGAYFAGRLADKFGRVRCMLAASFLFLISALGSGMPFGIPDFIFWRAVGGAAIGIASIIAPIYIAETAPAHLRGRLGSMQQFAIVIGIFAALLSNWLVVRFAMALETNAILYTLPDFILQQNGGFANAYILGSTKAWQWMFWLEIIPALLYGFFALRLPESPRFLVSQGRLSEAKEVLAKISPDDVDDEIDSIASTFKNSTPTKLSDLFETLTNGKRRIAPIIWAGLGIAIFQQLVGINVIFYYGNMLWQSIGFTENDSMLLNVLSSIVNISMTIVAILLIDKIGRKPLLLIGSIGMTFSLGLLAYCFLTAATDIYGNLLLAGISGPLSVLAANLFIIFFAMTWGPVMWVMLGEMFNNRIRAVAIAVCGLAQWGANFLVTFTFPILSGTAGPGLTYALYTFFAFTSIFFVWKFVKETKQKALEEM